jgi:hypothetical protein
VVAAGSLIFRGTNLSYQEAVLGKSKLKSYSASGSEFTWHVALAWFYNLEVVVAMLHER